MLFKRVFGSLAVASMVIAGCAVEGADGAAPEESSASVASALGENSLIRGLGGLCLDVQNGSTAWETPVQMWPCNGTAAQQWHITPSGDIRNVSDLCLDVKNGSTAAWTPVQTYPCTGNAAQKWEVRSDGSIRGLGGLCLDVRNGSTAAGTVAQMYPCTGNAAQKWSFQALSRCVEHSLGSFRAKWAAMGAESSWLGCATTDAYQNADGSWTAIFEKGVIYQNGSTPYAMERNDYDAWQRVYGYTGKPAGDSFRVGSGWATRMSEGGSTIIWNPVTGGQVARGGIGDEYWKRGGPTGSLGFPVENERDPSSNRAYQVFQGGTICWKSWWFFGSHEDTMVASSPSGCWASSGGGGGGGTPYCTAGYAPPFGCGAGQYCYAIGSGAVCGACGGEGQICCPSNIGPACASPADVCQDGSPTPTSGGGTCVYHLP